MKSRSRTPAAGVNSRTRKPGLCVCASAMRFHDPLIGFGPTHRDAVPFSEPQGPAMRGDATSTVESNDVLHVGTQEHLLPDHAGEMEVGRSFLDPQENAFRS